MSLTLFISYSHRDEDYKNNFEEHLATLKRQKILSVWHDRKIGIGSDWSHEISSNLDSANIIVFLISSSFIASDYCYDVEVQHAMRKHDEKSAIVIPVVVRPCDWKSAPFGSIQGCPKDAVAVTKWTDEDSAWLDVVERIRKLTESRTTTPVTPKDLSISQKKILSKGEHEKLD